MGRSTRLAAAWAAGVLLTVAVPAGGAHAADTTPRIDLRLLVVDDGGPATEAIRAELAEAGTPYTQVDLTAAGRQRIDEAFLSDTVDGRPRAKFQGVVLPNDNPFGDGSPEMAALASYEKRFGIRQVDAYTYARPAVGLNTPADGGYSGPLDGKTAQVTSTGAAGPFGYLRKNVPFEDNDTAVNESYGYLATPLEKQADGATYTSLLDAPIPGGSARGSLIGEYAHDGRSELVVTFVANQYQTQFRLVSRGIVEWLTQGAHLGAARNYFGVHVDDVFAADDRWDTKLKCTPGDVDCPGNPNPDSPAIRMKAADAQYAKQWSQSHKLTLDLAYNGVGSEEYRAEHGGAADPLLQQLVADQQSYRWINHTFTHAFLGCEQNTSVVPWKCATDIFGRTRWVSRLKISGEIDGNTAWAAKQGLVHDKDELVTGEHSGLKTLPQQTEDNPELAPVLGQSGVGWVASDNSRERQQRPVGSALTVPRYPMNVYYNVGTAAEQTDEYNWLYTKKADGGSGICEKYPETTTCMKAPLDTRTGFASYIAPLESRIALGHVLANDPRPHFMHQSNLSEQRIGYTVLEKVLADYNGLFADNTPLVNLRMRDIGTELSKRAAWKTALAAGKVTAYRIGNAVTVSAPDGTQAAVTLPTGTVQTGPNGSGTAFGSAYAGARSGWTAAGTQTPATFTLPGTAPAAHSAGATAARVQAPAAALPVPQGVAHRVPYGPADAAATTARR
ncbi:hypothetical protein AF335_26340 [Streptomyces eurocidicus]|uniref:Lipoprotein n=1 Tax=Streptomyces eurocidicus TaxID=66423 RepID=A0A2N8NQ32_STREU|nr:hypothetical protein [Streptomyces eurocidicus]MBB5122342.1 hypothetical protein [Streptomyces eurocidicus]MBF6051627.1 hypothetical protein [Streptomyces eurocidicus]PNE30879.1 hypothetical protein AF335_26340 [Streptomyces eurocidicus]